MRQAKRKCPDERNRPAATPDGFGKNSTAADNSRILPAAPARKIVLREEPFHCGFDVFVKPPFEDGRSFDKEHATYCEARAYAGGLRIALRLPLADEAGENA